MYPMDWNVPCWLSQTLVGSTHTHFVYNNCTFDACYAIIVVMYNTTTLHGIVGVYVVVVTGLIGVH